MLMDVNMRAVLLITLIFLILEWTQAEGFIKTPPTNNCKENEEFSKCDNHGCQNTCSEPDLIARCTYAPGCYPGCICKNEYVRNNHGICVPECGCVPIRQCTGKNEEYSECGNNGCQNTCANPNIAMVCKGNCVSGCICSEGFLRNSIGVCVEPKKCDLIPQCTGKNEEYSECGNNGCQNTCANPTISLVCKGICLSGCICSEGFLRNSKGVCVEPENCAPKCKGPNEEFVSCKNPCPATCNTITGTAPQQICLPLNPCPSGCDCISGYVRNSKNICVKAESCSCSDPNAEVVQCPNPCPGGNCITPEFLPCKAPCKIYGCQCKQGYVKNAAGICILLKKCPVSCDGEPNTVFAPCGDRCPVTCNNKDNGPIFCPQVCLEEGGCRCRTGYVRNIRNKCILPEQCPKCNENEFFDCGSACDTTCKTLGQTCPIINIVCNERCYCIDGYARDKKNVCIPIKRCPHK